MCTLMTSVVRCCVAKLVARGAKTVLGLAWLLVISPSPLEAAAIKTWSGTPDANRRWNITNGTNFNEGVYADGDDVRFGNSVNAPGQGNVFLQNASGVNTDVSPASMEVRRGTSWIFQGGKILSGSLLIDNTAQVAFTGYSTAHGFSSVTVNQGNLIYNAGAAGSYRFANVPITYTGLGDTYTFSTTNTGTFEIQDDFIFSNTNNANLTANGQGSSSNFQFSGDITLNSSNSTTLNLNGSNDSHFMQLGGEINISGTKTISMPNMQDVRLTGSLTGGAGTNLTLAASNGDLRTYTMPSSGANVDVGYLRFHTSRAIINPTNTTEDYFQTIRNHGGKVELAHSATNFSHQQAELRLRNGSFQSSDFIVAPATGSTYTLRNRLILDNSGTGFNPTLSGTFLVGGAGSIPALLWNKNPSATAQVNGNLQIGSGGILYLQSTSGTTSTTFTLNGNMSMLGGSILDRPIGRTSRLQITSGNQLTLGDGNASTAETITMRGIALVSGGPNEAWGFDVNSVVDDGNVTLRYVGPAGSESNSQHKYAVSWRNATGTLQPFRGGSAGTIFAPDATWGDSSLVNDGMVLQGAGSTVFTSSGAVVHETSGLITFATNLAAHNVAHTRGNVLITGATGSFHLANGGKVRANLFTMQNGATLSGTGKLVSNVVVSDAILAPGASAGLLNINGNLTFQGTSNELQIEITGGGAVAGVDYDQVAVTGSVTGINLATLVVEIDSVPAGLLEGDSFTLITSTTDFSGQQFADVIFDGYTYDLIYGDGFISLTNIAVMVPEPSSLWLCTVGMVVLNARRRRKNVQ